MDFLIYIHMNMKNEPDGTKKTKKQRTTTSDQRFRLEAGVKMGHEFFFMHLHLMMMY